MPNTQSAKKALRSSSRKRQYNLVKKYKIKNSLKELRKVVEINPSEYQASLSKAFSALDKAVKSNLIHRNKASRKKSRLALWINKVLNKETEVENIKNETAETAEVKKTKETTKK